MRSVAAAERRELSPRLGELAPGESRELIEGALGLAREHLEMDIAWLAEFTGDLKIFRALDGDEEGWSLWEGYSMPGAESYCRRMLDGRLPNAVADASKEEAVKDLEVTRRLGIAGYIGVPLVLSDGRIYGAFCCASRSPANTLGERDVKFMQVLSRLVARELDRLQLEQEQRRLEGQVAGLEALLAALEARDRYTGHHAQAVVDLAVRVALRLGLPPTQVDEVEQVALLHDIGKVAVPDRLLHKTAPFDDDDWRLMREHPETAERIISSIASLAHLAPALRAAHERWDGSGYPDGLAGEDIPLASRVTFLCDSYDAMTSDRPYRPALDFLSALDEVRRNAGTQFWPEAVDALLAEIGAAGGLSPREEEGATAASPRSREREDARRRRDDGSPPR